MLLGEKIRTIVRDEWYPEALSRVVAVRLKLHPQVFGSGCRGHWFQNTFTSVESDC